MSQPNLPEEDHIVRFVPWQRVRKDADDNAVGIMGEAFARREGEDGLSVNWLEKAHTDPAKQLEETVKIFRATMRVGGKARVAVCNVGKVKGICRRYNAKIRIVHIPKPGNDPHSEVRQLPREDLELHEMLAVEAIKDHQLCKDVFP